MKLFIRSGTMFFGAKKVIGLDIGTTTIKMAELDVGRKASSLLSFGVIPTPPQAYVTGDIANTQTVAEAIRELRNTLATKRKHVSTGLGGTSVIVKRISIPRIDEALIAEQIRWEAEQYIPYDINEVNLGFEVLRHTPQGQDVMDILLVAAVQSHVFKYAEAVSLAGLDCSIIDVGGFAFANCFKANYGDLPGQTVALFNVGAAATTMVVLESGEVTFCRDIPVGGLTYTQDLQKSLSISYEEAEALKISLSTTPSAPAEAQSAVQSTHEVVSEEIKASIEFYLNSSQSQKINRVFITGGGSKVFGFMERFAKIVPCERFDPFLKVKPKGRSFTPQYVEQVRDIAALAVGLGLRTIGDA